MAELFLLGLWVGVVGSGVRYGLPITLLHFTHARSNDLTDGRYPKFLSQLGDVRVYSRMQLVLASVEHDQYGKLKNHR